MRHPPSKVSNFFCGMYITPLLNVKMGLKCTQNAPLCFRSTNLFISLVTNTREKEKSWFNWYDKLLLAWPSHIVIACVTLFYFYVRSTRAQTIKFSNLPYKGLLFSAWPYLIWIFPLFLDALFELLDFEFPPFFQENLKFSSSNFYLAGFFEIFYVEFLAFYLILKYRYCSHFFHKVSI